MRNRTFLTGIVAALLLLVSCAQQATETKGETKSEPVSAAAFRNAAIGPNPDYKGPVFKLSHDYPKQAPASDCKECTWLSSDLKVNFKTQFPAKKMPPNAWTEGHWAKYIQRVLDYVKQGQDDNLADQIGFRTDVNGGTRWYNVPWMAVDQTAGREFIHGTTNERTVHASDLVGNSTSPHSSIHRLPMTGTCSADEQKYGFESWSVGFYNNYGAYGLGATIPPSGKPEIKKVMGVDAAAGLPFANNTVVVKILTSSATPACVPFLEGAPEWTVDRHVLSPEKGYQCERKPQKTRVVQVDIAVVDPRSPTRWVYGTFVYNGKKKGNNFWERLMPLGLQWGSDPWTFPAVPRSESMPLQQSVINPDVVSGKSPDRLYEHLGCEGRLAGPVDSAFSSCVSCHASGYGVLGSANIMGSNIPPSFGFDGACSNYSAENVAYFQNNQFPNSYPDGRYPNTVSMDTSLQLQVAFDQYSRFVTNNPRACTLGK